MDALRLLKKQHRKVEQLFGGYEKLSRSVGKGRTIDRGAGSRSPSTGAGESLASSDIHADVLTSRLNTAAEQPRAARQLVSEVLRRTAQPERLEARVRALQARIRQQIQLDEDFEIQDGQPQASEDLLRPQVERHMSAEERAALGAQMNRLFERLFTPEPHSRPGSSLRPGSTPAASR